MRIPGFLVRQKFRFDIGQGFLTVVNFAFIVVAASDTLSRITGVRAGILIPILIPLAPSMVWLLGFVLDKMQFQQAYQQEQNIRNKMLSEVHSKINGE